MKIPLWKMLLLSIVTYLTLALVLGVIAEISFANPQVGRSYFSIAILVVGPLILTAYSWAMWRLYRFGEIIPCSKKY